MQEEIDMTMAETEEGMTTSYDHLKDELTKIRAGKANPLMLNGLLVDYYGSPTPITQVANISASDARTLVIKPWEKPMIGPIEKSIFEANLGMTPQNDGEVVRLSIPPMTEERRKDLVKKVKGVGEDAKVGIRSSRHKAMDFIKKSVKDGYPEDSGKRREDEVQKMTDAFVKKIDELIEAKEKDIMTV